MIKRTAMAVALSALLATGALAQGAASGTEAPATPPAAVETAPAVPYVPPAADAQAPAKPAEAAQSPQAAAPQATDTEKAAEAAPAPAAEPQKSTEAVPTPATDATTPAPGATAAAVPSTVDSCIAAAANLGKSAEGRTLSDDKVDKLDQLFSKMETLCDGKQFDEAMAVATDIKTMIDGQ